MAIYNINENESSLRIIGSIKQVKTDKGKYMQMSQRFTIPEYIRPDQCFATYTKDLPSLINVPAFNNKSIFDFGISQ
jgi:hypothetical protein